MPDAAEIAPPDDAEVAAPPRMPVQSALYITPDGRVQFGALFAELLPVARALDPAFPAPPAPKQDD